MKIIFGPILAALVLSTIAWVLMYYAVPERPLGKSETILVVFAFTVLAFSVEALLKRRRGSKGASRRRSPRGKAANEKKPTK